MSDVQMAFMHPALISMALHDAEQRLRRWSPMPQFRDHPSRDVLEARVADLRARLGRANEISGRLRQVPEAEQKAELARIEKELEWAEAAPGRRWNIHVRVSTTLLQIEASTPSEASKKAEGLLRGCKLVLADVTVLGDKASESLAGEVRAMRELRP